MATHENAVIQAIQRYTEPINGLISKEYDNSPSPPIFTIKSHYPLTTQFAETILITVSSRVTSRYLRKPSPPMVPHANFPRSQLAKPDEEPGEEGSVRRRGGGLTTTTRTTLGEPRSLGDGLAGWQGSAGVGAGVRERVGSRLVRR